MRKLELYLGILTTLGIPTTQVVIGVLTTNIWYFSSLYCRKWAVPPFLTQT